MHYFFILGNHPHLSLAEIVSVLKNKKYTTQNNTALFDLPLKTDLTALQNSLGGTIKIGRLVAETARDNLTDEIYQAILKHIKESKKINFGISVYNTKIEIKKIALNVKKKLKAKKIKSRWVFSGEKILSSVSVKNNQLVGEKGLEIVILNPAPETRHGAPLQLGITETVQPFAELSQRDYSRPVRDTHSGMLPPKLAQIMINLAQAEKNSALLDPFCGSGTILQEALLLGYQNIIGADFSKKAIEASQKNLSWLKESLKRENFILPQIINSDIGKLEKHLAPNSIDAVVSEPYLGPVLSGNESKRKIYQIIESLNHFYLTSFQAFCKLLKENGRIVLVFPIIQGKKLDILKKIKQIGFAQDQQFAKLYDNPYRQSFLYGRKGQKIWREVFVLQKTKG